MVLPQQYFPQGYIEGLGLSISSAPPQRGCVDMEAAKTKCFVI